jgi:tetratricopeptide (TPR) repeat protein
LNSSTRNAFGLLLGAALWFAMSGASPVLARPHDSASPSPSPSPISTPAPTAEPPNTAIPRLEAKLKATPDDRQSMAELASYYLQVNRPDLAVNLTSKLLSLGERRAQIYYIDGLSNQQLGRIQQATASLEQAANLEPTNSQVLLTLTDLYQKTNRSADAERVAKRATTFNPTDPRVFINYGLVLAQEKKADDARAQFEIAAKLDPKDATPIVLEARSYIDEKAISLAQSTFDRALTIDPKNQDALVGKAQLYSSQHDVKNSIATYEILLANATDDTMRSRIIVEEARVYAIEKMFPEAEGQLKRAVATYPTIAANHIAYGDYYADRRDFKNAEAEWLIALGPNRDNGEAIGRLADFYLQNGQAPKAIDLYKRYTDLSPNDAQGWSLLARAYAVNRQYDRSRDAYRHSFELQQTPQSFAGVGAADFELKNYKEAAAIFSGLDKQAPDFIKANPQLLFIMGKVYTANNQKDKALSAYNRLLAFVPKDSPTAKQVKDLIVALNAGPSSSKPTPKPKK